jgi:hypothetical protein
MGAVIALCGRLMWELKGDKLGVGESDLVPAPCFVDTCGNEMSLQFSIPIHRRK